MFVDCDLIASFNFMTDFNGIDRQYPYPNYNPGIYDGDKQEYKYGPPSSEYPNLTLSENLYDQFGNSISPGFYMIVISDDRKFLNMYQSNELKARVKIFKLVEEMKTQDELNEELELKAKITKWEEKNNIKKLKKAQEDYKAYLDTQAAKSYAKIEDSGKGYYILEYNCFGKKAQGIIQK